MELARFFQEVPERMVWSDDPASNHCGQTIVVARTIHLQMSSLSMFDQACGPLDEWQAHQSSESSRRRTKPGWVFLHAPSMLVLKICVIEQCLLHMMHAGCELQDTPRLLVVLFLHVERHNLISPECGWVVMVTPSSEKRLLYRSRLLVKWACYLLTGHQGSCAYTRNKTRAPG